LKKARDEKRKVEILVNEANKKIAKIEGVQSTIVAKNTAARHKYLDQVGYGSIEEESSARPLSKHHKRREAKKTTCGVARALSYKTP
jgi:hypothetical protein